MQIGKLSKITGVSVRSLRHYEQKKLIHSERMDNRYRVFDDSVVEKVKTIRIYLGLGITTDEISKILECPIMVEEQQPLCEKAIVVYETKLKDINEQITILENIRTTLEKRISNFRSQ